MAIFLMFFLFPRAMENINQTRFTPHKKSICITVKTEKPNIASRYQQLVVC